MSCSPIVLSLFILYECCWGYGGWELPTQVSSMLSRRSAMATMTRTWFNHCNFMMKMIRLLLIISYYNTINVPHKDRDNAPKLLLQIRKLHTMRVPVTFWWWHLPAFAIPLLCGNTLQWWFWNKWKSKVRVKCNNKKSNSQVWLLG